MPIFRVDFLFCLSFAALQAVAAGVVGRPHRRWRLAAAAARRLAKLHDPAGKGEHVTKLSWG